VNLIEFTRQLIVWQSKETELAIPLAGFNN